jgi:hypothetical protein
MDKQTALNTIQNSPHTSVYFRAIAANAFWLARSHPPKSYGRAVGMNHYHSNRRAAQLLTNETADN